MEMKGPLRFAFYCVAFVIATMDGICHSSMFLDKLCQGDL
ncbi:hypothetical protein OHAE_4322 [Ochrobactrum soli]|uniref:Uncharacterized protein n=1 Tax=Ochrobactrum soli TaxID=2448455 RepID=A0A2P9HCG1_9HYPH|nr:hypothetical protein OHAE_4322 [[Ochrobactrum] soli]